MVLGLSRKGHRLFISSHSERCQAGDWVDLALVCAAMSAVPPPHSTPIEVGGVYGGHEEAPEGRCRPARRASPST